MNAERLLQAKEFLKTVPEERFDVKFYRQGDHKSRSIKRLCDTVGCAMGWLTGMIPESDIVRYEDKIINFNLTGQKYFGLKNSEMKFLFSCWCSGSLGTIGILTPQRRLFWGFVYCFYQTY